jgi:hypothetical protein
MYPSAIWRVAARSAARNFGNFTAGGFAFEPFGAAKSEEPAGAGSSGAGE